MQSTFSSYWRLVRGDRLIGTWLLLWPAWWALWLAAGGTPQLHLWLVFTGGVFLMRAAGCAMNDYADRHIDGMVQRTNDRPLITGEITPRAAIMTSIILALGAFLLVLTTNWMTVALSVVAVFLTVAYPFMKRVTHFPQIVLGAAFTWSVPMAFAATQQSLPTYMWLLFAAGVAWTVAYDTFYAMADRVDDLKIGVKSTAIWLGRADLPVIAALQCVMLALLVIVGQWVQLGMIYYYALIVAAVFFIHQIYTARHRKSTACFRAFLANNYVGLIIWVGIALDLFFRPI